MLNAIVIAGFDKSAGKSLIGIPSKVSLIKDLSLIKDKGHIDSRGQFFGSIDGEIV